MSAGDTTTFAVTALNTGYYNAMANTEFSVGELWLSDNTRVPKWIKDSADCIENVDSVPSRAFDFATKNALNAVFGNPKNAGNNYNASSKVNIPNKNYNMLDSKDLLFRQMPAYAVTFVDNHDTGSTQSMLPIDRNDLAAAYTFILTHPGVPCVAWQHYFSGVSDSTASDSTGRTDNNGKTLHDHIKDLVLLRTKLNITNTSKIEIQKSSTSTYTACITGTEGSVVVSIGSSLTSCPNGYTEKCKGTNFAVYVKEN